MPIPDNMRMAICLVGGFTIFLLGLSFAWKFVQAALHGKVEYWSGLEKFGFLFFPITVFVSPLLCHLPYNPNNSLIQTRQSLWVHLVFGPIFFIASLMCMTSGADMMGLPGSSFLNTVLTCGRSDVPPCIVYSPPPPGTLAIGQYRFPFAKKATRTVIKFICTKIPTKKEESWNVYEQKGEDVEQYSKSGIPWIDGDDDDDTPAAPNQPSATAPRK